MTRIDALPPLREVIARHDLRAKKQLGQNFLLDLNLTARIARAAGDLTQCDVLEIGPGPGGLTRGLLAEGARHVLAIEKDVRAIPALQEIADACPGRLTIIHGDALDVDPLAHLTPPVRIAANLPYNVGTELLIRWLTPPQWPPFWQSLTLMFQKEVAQRIVAKPGSKAYGRLALLAQGLQHVEGAEHVGLPCLVGIGLQQRDVLQRRCVEDDLRSALEEQLLERLGIADIGQDGVPAVEQAAARDGDLRGLQVGLVAVEHHQLAGLEGQQLAAQLRADGAAGTRD